ncbi:MAG: radical SAM protein, partial [Candidatus Micrarchaeota archaeon]
PGAPMGLFSIKGTLKRAGMKCSVFDVDPMGGIDEFRKSLAIEKPRVVGITSLSFQINEAVTLAREAKQFDSGVTVILGGPHATVGWREVLEDYEMIDLCCVGGGEDVMVELCSGTKFEQVSGLAYRKDGQTVFTGPRVCSIELDSHIPDRTLHSPSYDFNILYHENGTPLKTAQSVLTVGCPHNCVFCTEPIRAGRSRESGVFRIARRSPESVETEMRGLKELGYGFVYFDDSTFTINRDYAKAISTVMGNVGLAWGCNTRVDCIGYKMASKMARDGCRYIFCGFESAVPEVLVAMRKTRNPKYYLKCAKEVYAWLGELGFNRMAYIIFGGPKMMPDGSIGVETLEDAKRSIDFVVDELKPIEVSPSGFRLLPGTTASTDVKYASLWPDGRPISPRDYHKGERLTTHPIMDGLEGKGSVNSADLGSEKTHKIVQYLLTVENEGGPRINFTAGFNRYIIKKNGFKELMPLNEMTAG